MDRRRFLTLSSAGAAALTVPGLNPLAQPLPEHPNVLLILLEDAPDWFGCLGGHPDTVTPRIDALAERGVLFTNAHCASPLCNPARTSMFLGIRPDTSNVHWNSDDWRTIVPPQIRSMPRYFRDNGYMTIRSGKIFHDSFDDPTAWDRHYLETQPNDLPGRESYAPIHPWSGMIFDFQETSFFDWGATDVKESEMTDTRRANALKLLLQGSSQELQEPFFMCLGTNKTHFPAIVPRRYLEKFSPASVHLPEVLESDFDDIPPIVHQMLEPFYHRQTVNHKQWRKAIATYLATLNFADTIAGQVIDALDRSQYANNTIVILTADHGFHLGEKMHWRKATLWQESTHVIITMHIPGVTAAGSRCGEAVSHLDLYPTLMNLCNLQAPGWLEGQDLSPLLENPAQERVEPAVITFGPGNHAVVDERWRYIRYTDGSEELYDRPIDPNEWTNLAGDPQYDDVKQTLSQWIPVI